MNCIRYFILTLLVGSSIFVKAQTITYEYTKFKIKGKPLYCLINGADTIKITSQAFIKTSKSRYMYTAQGRYQFRYNKDKKVNEFFDGAGQLQGTSSMEKFMFWTITSPDGTIYKHGYDKNDFKYLINDKEVIKAIFVKRDKKKLVELHILDPNIENFEFVKNMVLAERIKHIQEVDQSTRKVLGTMLVVGVSVALTVSANQNSPVK